MKIFPVIIAGGSGNRLWSVSHKVYPKQFLALNYHLVLEQEILTREQGNAVMMGDRSRSINNA